MSETPKPQIGKIGWIDLTVPDAVAVKDFYTQVVGWQAEPHDMGDYHDFDIKSPETGDVVTGICHARGSNANIPPQWIIYITAENVPESAQRVVDLGGKIVDGPRDMGGMEFCLIQDPAGAVAALISY
jgi:hypothetical protein